MRLSVLVVCGVLFFSCPAHSNDVVTQRIPAKSDTLLMINGQWVPAEDGYYTVVMDSNITVNGVEYIPKEQPPVPYEEPSLERGFVDYMVRKPLEEAQKLIDTGGSYEDAFKLMDFFYKQHKSDSLEVEFKEGLFFLKYRGQEVGVPVPRQKTEPRVGFSYRKGVLEPTFRELCSTIEKGIFSIRTSSSIQYFLPEDNSLVIQQLREVPQRAKIRKYVGKVPIYEPMVIKGKHRTYKLFSSNVEYLVKASGK